MNRIKKVLPLIVAGLLFLGSAAIAAPVVNLCAPTGAAAIGTTMQTRYSLPGYVADANGCIAFDIAKDPNGVDLGALESAGWTINNFGSHIISNKTGALAGVGTGTVTAGGTDNAMEVTGATSPLTITFTTPFANKPICVCGDETASTAACRIAPTTTNALATFTTTDTIMVVCIGK